MERRDAWPLWTLVHASSIGRLGPAFGIGLRRRADAAALGHRQHRRRLSLGVPNASVQQVESCFQMVGVVGEEPSLLN